MADTGWELFHELNREDAERYLLNRKGKGFVIAGADGKYKVANDKIDGDVVVVWNESIQDPVSVRHAWAGSPKCNLYNLTGLSAVPFKTDINKH